MVNKGQGCLNLGLVISLLSERGMVNKSLEGLGNIKYFQTSYSTCGMDSWVFALFYFHCGKIYLT